MTGKIRVGISSCLLGEKVRYDGGHKLDHYLRDTLGKYIDWVPVCPEVEYGLPVPREAMHLLDKGSDIRLVTIRTGTDHTDGMREWAVRRLEDLANRDLCGFVFKSRSPSSGMMRVKVYGPSGAPTHNGVGIFAAAFMQRFPFLPVEDSGRLQDPSLRENFIERLFVFMRWKDMLKQGANMKDLVSFHTDHKLLILSHSTKHYTELGRLIAGGSRLKKALLFEQYLKVLLEGLCLQATAKKNTNVLQHIAGYFKKQLSADEKKELSEVIGIYHQGLVPLVVPIALLNHYARKYDEPYLLRQVYMSPHPLELMLRNHV